MVHVLVRWRVDGLTVGLLSGHWGLLRVPEVEVSTVLLLLCVKVEADLSRKLHLDRRVDSME
jgi:hypothetical protein